MSVCEEYLIKMGTEDEDDEQTPDDEWDVVNKTCQSCKKCAVCCYYVLQRYNLLTDSYHLIGLGYKFLLTLSVTQVACERSFSTLIFIKN